MPDPTPLPKKAASLPANLAELKKEFTLALTEGEDVMSAFEKGLVESLLGQLESKRAEFQMSANQAEAWKKVRQKMKREGIFS